MRKDNQDTFYEVRKDDTKWMDSKGFVHEINEMDLWHIYNTVNMLRRKNKQIRELSELHKITLVTSDEEYQMGKKEFEIPDLMIKRLNTEFAEKYPEYMI